MIVFFIIFLTDLFMIGIMALVYRGCCKYNRGMILGVHIPESAAGDERVQKIAQTYQRKFRYFYLANALLSSGIALLCLEGMAAFLVCWSIWLCVFLAGGMALNCLARRRMYDLKAEQGWIVGKPVADVLIDTAVSAKAGLLPFSSWWHLPAVLLTLAATFFWIPLKEFSGPGPDRFLLPGVLLFTEFSFWGLHIWFAEKKRVVYSMDTELNLQLNRLEKRVWSGIWIASDYLNLAAFAFMVLPDRGVNRGGIFGMCMFTILEIVLIAGLIAALLWLRRKKEVILKGIPNLAEADDDIYWRNGWYSNPKDRRIFVQDRMFDTNITVNMGRMAGRVIAGSTAVLTVGCLAWMCVMFLRMEYTEMKLAFEGNTVQVVAGGYEISFDRDEVQELAVLDEMPEQGLRRINGASTDQYLLGKFRGTKSGDCRLYLYRGYYPILKMVLPEYNVLINSRTPGTVEQWYQELCEGADALQMQGNSR